MIGTKDIPIDVIDFSEPEIQVREHVRAFLSGKINLEKMFERVSPLYEDTSSPTAEQVVKVVGYYSFGKITLGQVRKFLEEMADNMRSH